MAIQPRVAGQSQGGCPRAHMDGGGGDVGFTRSSAESPGGYIIIDTIFDLKIYHAIHIHIYIYIQICLSGMF